MARLLPLLLAAAALVAPPSAAATGPMAFAGDGLRPRGSTLRVVVLPIKEPGQAVPARPRLEAAFHRAAALMARVSRGRLLLTFEIGPVYAPPRGENGAVSDRRAVERSVARGVVWRGATPVYVRASPRPGYGYGSTWGAELQGTSWRIPQTVVHELGHTLGLAHALAPTSCRRPFAPLACAEHPRHTHEYGDLLDVMGGGASAFGAFTMVAARLAPPTDAPPAGGAVALRPVDGTGPTALRLRAADRDWYVETRRRVVVDGLGGSAAPRGVAISRVVPRYAPGADLFPEPLRVPATNPAVACRGVRACLARQIFAPGRTLTVPGAFRLRVLTRGRRVAVTWLDRTPPALTVAGASVVRRPGAGAELTLDLRADATGAGVLWVEVDQRGTVTRVPADAAPGLVAGRRGSGAVTVPLVAGATSARVRLIDAAGNASAPADVALGALPVSDGATVSMNPAPGRFPADATPLADGTVTVSGATTAAMAGLPVRIDLIGSSAQTEAIVAPDGTFSAAITPPGPGLYAVVARVPVGRLPDGITLRHETATGHYRA
ncbi:MAG: hypothetical protein AB7V42_02810 [Thermoleophilia bacterium]